MNANRKIPAWRIASLSFVASITLASPSLWASTIPPKSEGMAMDHSHMPIHLPKGMQQPKLSLAIHKDAMSGFNLELMTANFHMVPPPYEIQTMAELMDAPNSKDGKTVEGHAHLYINGEKISRVYSRYLHLPGTLFKKGVNQVTISLNNHAHMPWHSDKKQILATLVINPDLDKVLVHRFESFPVAPQAAKK